MNQKLPEHVAIVMDGNGRWAKHRGLERFEGHSAGVESVRAAVQCCLKQRIPVLSLFAFSSENWARPVMEVEFLMGLFLTALQREISALHQQGVSVRFMGDRSLLSERLCQEMVASEQLTRDNQALILNFGLNYGGKWDIVQAAKKMARSILDGMTDLDSVDELQFDRLLSTHALPAPDLFIRTGGEQRVSNFFLWQLAYTELYFSEVYWPDFTALELEKALASFASRKRRFGQIEGVCEKPNV